MRTKATLILVLFGLIALGPGCATKPARLGDNTAYYNGAVFAPDGHSLAAIRNAGSEGVVFDVASRIETARFRPDKKLKAGFMFGLAYTPEGTLLAALTWKNQVAIWDATASNLVAHLVLPKAPTAGQLSPDGRWLATLVPNQPLTIWEVATGRKEVELTNYPPVKALLGFSQDGKRFATLGSGHGIQVWETATGGFVGELPPQKESACFLAFAPGGGQLAVSAGNVSLFSLDSQELTQTFKSPSLGTGAKVTGVLWILASTFGGHPSGSSEVFSRAPSGPVVFSPTGSHLAIVNSAANADTALGYGKQQVRVFDLANTQLVATVAYNTAVASIAFSPDGRWLATAGLGVEVWDWQASLRQASGHDAGRPMRPDPYPPVIVQLQTHFTSTQDTPLARMALRPVRVGVFTDARPEAALGKRTAAFKVKMSDILAARPVAESVREIVAGLFAKPGGSAVGGPPRMVISGRVKRFTVETPAGLLAWKVAASVEVELQVTNERGVVVHTASYTGEANHRTAAWIGETIIERTFNDALQQLLRHIEADPFWSTL